MPLTSKGVEKLVRDGKPGATADGGGLYLKITATGNASWQYRYQLAGRRRMMGLGPCSIVTLAQARERAAEARKLTAQGIDPLDSKKAEQTATRARQTTFDDMAKDYIAAHRPGWRNAKHAQQWENTLAQYASPKIGNKTIDAITTDDVLSILRELWQAKAETASRLRNRIELVIDAARAQGLSVAPNPAAWRGHLDKLLPKRSKASRTHHAAMDYRELPAFFKALHDDRSSASSIALQLTILTACRTSEVLNSKGTEFDIANKLWTIPGERMKAGRAHRVPLVDEVLALLKGLDLEEGYVFPGAREGRPLSNMSMAMVLRRLKHPDLTVHGFRSTFRDWCAEETHYPNIVAEQALAHAVGNAVEAAYRRGDLLEKRRALMVEWAQYCLSATASDRISEG